MVLNPGQIVMDCAARDPKTVGNLTGANTLLQKQQ
jgi:hypothetical protein